MPSISAIFKPSADGSIHLPIPEELRGTARLRVVAWIEPDAEAPKKSSAGEWAKLARGIALPQAGETSDDARFSAMRQRLEAP
jgi:hypothetical protein